MKARGGKKDEKEYSHLKALKKTAQESMNALESLKGAIIKPRGTADRAELYGQYLILEMRQMAKRRLKLFCKEVEISRQSSDASPILTQAIIVSGIDP